MSIPRNDLAIGAFWSWFKTIADYLARDFENQQLLEELDQRVSTLGEVAWELGPGTTSENALAISPDGDPGLLGLTRRIVAMAPELPGWEFLPARPARSASLEFTISGDDARQIDVDARRWRYALFRFGDGALRLVLEQNSLPDVSEHERYSAAVVLLDGLLGEATRLLRIAAIDPVAVLSAAESAKANSITSLPAHLDEIDQSRIPTDT